MTDSASINYTGYIILSVGLTASNMVSKLIISTLAKKDLSPIQPEALGAAAFALAIRFASSLMVKKTLVVAFFVFCLTYSYLFSYHIVMRISRFLGIKVLSV